MDFIRATFGIEPPPSPLEPTEENRFHIWDESPSPDLRKRAATIRARAKCRMTGKDINFVCPVAGIPTHHSKDAWESDGYYHEHVKENLRKVNLYEHDLRSGREFPEFDFPREQNEDCFVNMGNWDTYFYTRTFYSMDTQFQLAAVTKGLSYPMTIASIVHQNSPYIFKRGNRITLEGLKSLAALRYTLHPVDRSNPAAFRPRPTRIFILGARAESQLPFYVWKQLSYLFPYGELNIVFVGPECFYDLEKKQYAYHAKPLTARYDNQLSFSWYTDYFHVYHEAKDLFPYDPYLDVFFLFHPGLGQPDVTEQWNKTVNALLESKCAIYSTGYHNDDINIDWNWLNNSFKDKFDILMEPGNNIFKSLRWETNDLDPQEIYQPNQKIFGFRGKRYPAIHKGKHNILYV